LSLINFSLFDLFRAFGLTGLIGCSLSEQGSYVSGSESKAALFILLNRLDLTLAKNKHSK